MKAFIKLLFHKKNDFYLLKHKGNQLRLKCQKKHIEIESTDTFFGWVWWTVAMNFWDVGTNSKCFLHCPKMVLTVAVNCQQHEILYIYSMLFAFPWRETFTKDVTLLINLITFPRFFFLWHFSRSWLLFAKIIKKCGSY